MRRSVRKSTDRPRVDVEVEVLDHLTGLSSIELDVLGVWVRRHTIEDSIDELVGRGQHRARERPTSVAVLEAEEVEGRQYLRGDPTSTHSKGNWGMRLISKVTCKASDARWLVQPRPELGLVGEDRAEHRDYCAISLHGPADVARATQRHDRPVL